MNLKSSHVILTENSCKLTPIQTNFTTRDSNQRHPPSKHSASLFMTTDKLSKSQNSSRHKHNPDLTPDLHLNNTHLNKPGIP